MSNISIGKRIKEYRLEKNLTQQELADKIGVTWEMISRYERDESKPFFKLESIANALDISMNDILQKNNNQNIVYIKSNKVELLDKNISNKGIFKIDIEKPPLRESYVVFIKNKQYYLDKYKGQTEIIGTLVSQIITY